MDKDRIEGSAQQAKGTLRRFFGRLFGDKKMQVKGAAEERAGEIQTASGALKDEANKK